MMFSADSCLHSGNTAGMLGGPYRMLGIELGLTACKGSTQLAVLSFQFLNDLNLFCYISLSEIVY